MCLFLRRLRLAKCQTSCLHTPLVTPLPRPYRLHPEFYSAVRGAESQPCPFTPFLLHEHTMEEAALTRSPHFRSTQKNPVSQPPGSVCVSAAFIKRLFPHFLTCAIKTQLRLELLILFIIDLSAHFVLINHLVHKRSEKSIKRSLEPSVTFTLLS